MKHGLETLENAIGCTAALFSCKTLLIRVSREKRGESTRTSNEAELMTELSAFRDFDVSLYEAGKPYKQSMLVLDVLDPSIVSLHSVAFARENCAFQARCKREKLEGVVDRV